MIFQLVVTSLFLTVTSGYKILGLFPHAAKSHFNVNNAIMKTLANAGHEVVVATPFPDQPPLENYSVVDLSENSTLFVSIDPKELSEITVSGMVELIMNNDRTYCEKLISHEQIRKWLQSDQKIFDVIFVEMIATYQCYAPLAEKWNIPIIGTTTMRSWSVPEKAIGNPRILSVIQEDVHGPWNLNSLCGRFRNTIDQLWMDLLMCYYSEQQNTEFYNKHKDVLGALSNYRNKKPSLVFFNTHFSFIPRALNPNAIEIAGIHVGKSKPLPKNIQKFIDGAEHGVIVFSLGSISRASSLPKGTLFAFREAFRAIPQRVIWKYEDPMDNVPDNVMLLPWLPQRDVIAHKNVKAVISHCGLGGTYEVITMGKPTIATPLFVDQFYNAVVLKEKGAAIYLDINSIDKKIVLDSINRIINDTSYLENMRKLSHAFTDRPMSPEQSVVYWTEYVIRHNGAPLLKTDGTDLNWFQYFLIDVFCCILFALAFLVFAAKWSFSKLKGYIFRKEVSKIKKK